MKASSAVSGHDFAGLRTICEMRPEVFQRGVVLYGGEDVVGFAPDLLAVPVRALWNW